MKRITVKNTVTNETDTLLVVGGEPLVALLKQVKKLYCAEEVYYDEKYFCYTPAEPKPKVPREKTYAELQAECKSFRKELEKIMNLQGNENNADEARIIAREARSTAKSALSYFPEVEYEN